MYVCCFFKEAPNISSEKGSSSISVANVKEFSNASYVKYTKWEAKANMVTVKLQMQGFHKAK